MVLAEKHVDALMKEYYLDEKYNRLRKDGHLKYIISEFPEGYMDKPVGVPDVVAFVHMGEGYRKNGRLEFNFFILAKREEPLASLKYVPDWRKSLSLWKYVPLFSEVPIKEDKDIVNRFNLNVDDAHGPFPRDDDLPRMEIIMPAKGGWMVRTDPNGFIEDATLLTKPPMFNPVELFNAGKGFPNESGTVDKLGKPFALFAFDKGVDITTMSELKQYESTNKEIQDRGGAVKWVVPARLSKPRCIHIDKPTLGLILKRVNTKAENDSCTDMVLLSESKTPRIVYSLRQLINIRLSEEGFSLKPTIFFIDTRFGIPNLVNLLYEECNKLQETVASGGRKRKSKKSMKNKRRTNRARKYTKKYRHRSLRR